MEQEFAIAKLEEEQCSPFDVEKLLNFLHAVPIDQTLTVHADGSGNMRLADFAAFTTAGSGPQPVLARPC